MQEFIIKPLAVGRGGIGVKKSEGDGITPIGDFAITMLMYRADKVAPPQTTLPCRAIGKDDIWVDDPNSPDYNKLLQAQDYDLDCVFSHEKLWRDDDIYDLLAVLDYNMNPTVAGAGSAIFVHLARAVDGDGKDDGRGGGEVKGDDVQGDDDMKGDDDVKGDGEVAGGVAKQSTEKFAPTEGCIALSQNDFYDIASRLTPASRLHIGDDKITITT